MAHTIRDKAKLLARVRRIQGQAAALEKQLAQEGIAQRCCSRSRRFAVRSTG